MTGFLRRLAEGAQNGRPGAPAVHPFVESSYAFDASTVEAEAPRPGAAFEPRTPEETPEPSGRREHGSPRWRDGAPRPPVEAGTEVALESDRRSEARPRPTTLDSVLEALRGDGAKARSPETDVGARDDAPPEPPGAARARARAELRAARAAHRPLLPASPALLPSAEARAESPEEEGNERRVTAPNASSSVAMGAASAVVGGGNDVHIHIGRIEVVAVPPAAPRPVAAPQRKGPSLDEYLRRKSTTGGAR